MFLRQLAEKLAKKDDKNYASVITWLRARLSFEILRSVQLSIRGSTKHFRRRMDVLEDFKLDVIAAAVLKLNFVFVIEIAISSNLIGSKMKK